MKNIHWFILFVLSVAISSCTTVEKLILKNELTAGENFCKKQKHDKPYCYSCLAEAFFNNAEYDKAGEMYKNTDNYTEGCKKIAEALFKEEEFEKAFMYYTEANFKEEGGVKIAEALIEEDEYEEAFEYFSKSDKRFIGAMRIAEILFEHEDYKEAFVYYSLVNKEEKGGIKIAEILCKKEDYEEAFNYYSLINKKEEGGIKIAEILFGKENYDKAFEFYCKAINNEGGAYRLLADKFVQNSTYDFAFLLYKLSDDKNKANRVKEQLYNKLANLRDGYLISEALPVSGLLIKDFCVFSIDDDFQLHLTGIISDNSIIIGQCESSCNQIQCNNKYLYYSNDDCITQKQIFNNGTKRDIHLHLSPVTDFICQEQYLVSAGWDEKVLLTQNLEESSFVGHKAAITSIAINTKYSTIYTGSWDNSIKKWDIENKQCIKTINTKTPITDICLSYNNKYILALSKSNNIYRWSEQTGKAFSALSKHKNMVTILEPSLNNRYFISGDFDGIVKIWDSKTFKVIKSISAHDSAITSISISEDASYFITGAMDHKLKFWRMPE